MGINNPIPRSLKSETRYVGGVVESSPIMEGD